MWLDKAFIACLALLLTCALGLQGAVKALGYYLRKEPLPLQSVLDDLDERKLEPYKVQHKIKIENDDIVAELGTEDYIRWVFEDSTVKSNDPTRIIEMFITYYTGDPDAVPHIPDRCILGSGGIIESARNTTIKVPDCQAMEDTVPVRILDVVKVDRADVSEDGMLVVYFFSVNGDFHCRRNRVRHRLNALTDRYAYFSKVEFYVRGGGADREEKALAAVEKLCRKVVPELVQSHWPQWPPVNNDVVE